MWILLAKIILSCIGYLGVGFMFVLSLRCGERRVWPSTRYVSDDDYGIVLFLWPIWIMMWVVYLIFWPFTTFFCWLPGAANDIADEICNRVRTARLKRRERNRSKQ